MAPSGEEAEVLVAAASLAADLEGPLHALPSVGLSPSAVLEVTAALKAADPYNEPGEGLKKWGGIYHATGREGEDGVKLTGNCPYMLVIMGVFLTDCL